MRIHVRIHVHIHMHIHIHAHTHAHIHTYTHTHSLALWEEFKTQARALLDSQNEDGGWTQVADWRRDAYATGTVLAALHDTGAIGTDAPAFQAGIRYLLGTQDRQGVWHVRSRTRAVQPFFGSGFPYERDQFISIAGTAWATYALLVTLPEARSPSPPSFLSVHSGLLGKSYGKRGPLTEEQTRFFNEKISHVSRMCGLTTGHAVDLGQIRCSYPWLFVWTHDP